MTESPHWSIVPVSTGGSTAEPVTLMEVKTALRLSVGDGSEDDYLSGRIKAARVYLENEYRQVIMRRQFDVFHDAVPCDGVLRMPSGPLASVVSITAFDREHAETVLSSSDYYADTASLRGRILLNDGASWPSGLRAANAIRSRVVLGHSTSPDTVPDPMREAVLQMVAFLYEHRGEGAGAFRVPPQVAELMDAYYVPEVA